MIKQKEFLSHVCFLIGISVLCGGCQPLRQKFIRKKTKMKEEKFIPILEPVDYGQNAVSMEEKYTHFYLVYTVWEKELVTAIEEDDSEKRLKNHLEQLVLQLQEMQKVAPIEIRNSLAEIIMNYQSLGPQIDKSKVFRNEDYIVSQMRKLERKVRNELKPDVIFLTDHE